MNWKEEFNEEFVDFQADDKEWWQTDYDFPKSATPIEVKDFISTLIEKIIEEAFSKIDHPCWKDNSHSHGVDMSDWEQQLRDKWLGKERE